MRHYAARYNVIQHRITVRRAAQTRVAAPILSGGCMELGPVQACVSRGVCDLTAKQYMKLNYIN